MADVDVLTHALHQTVKAHGIQTVEEAIHNLRQRHFEHIQLRQRMAFGHKHVLATIKRYEARVVDEDQDIREEFRDCPDLVAIFLTCLGEIKTVTKAALEGACDGCGRYGGHLRVCNEGTPDERTLCVECQQKDHE